MVQIHESLWSVMLDLHGCPYIIVYIVLHHSLRMDDQATRVFVAKYDVVMLMLGQQLHKLALPLNRV